MALLAGCSARIDLVQSEPYVEVRLTGTLEAQTKVGLNDDYSLSWEKGDRIMVSDGGKQRVFTALGSGASAEFGAEGVILLDDKTYYAIYPYSQAYINEDTLRVAIPSAFEGKQGVCPPLPSVASTDGKTRSLAFRNVCSLISFEIESDDITSVVIRGGAGEMISGVAEVPDPSSADATVKAGVDSVAISGSPVLEPGRYYVPVLPNNFSAGLDIVMNREDGSSIPRKYDAFSLGRSRYVDLEHIDTGRYIFYIIRDASSLQAFLDDAPGCESYVTARLQDDLDLSGVELRTASSFAGTFDGNGYGILNWKCTAPLFEELPEGASVSNLTIGSSCSLVFDGSSEELSFISRINRGSISFCTSDADFSVPDGDILYTTGAFAAVSHGSISDCTNNGGIICRGLHNAVGAIVGQNCGQVSGCVNNGDISVEGQCRAVGGIAGLVNGGGIIGSSKNSAPLSFVAEEADMVNFGGIAGLVDGGNLSGCTNEDRILVQGAAVSEACIGGIAGRAGAEEASSEWAVTSCRNNGSVEVSLSGAAFNVGGIAGWTSYAVATSSRNIGKVGVTIGIGAKANVGGVMGKSISEFKSVYNDGEITVKPGEEITSFKVGGIAGYMAGENLDAASGNHLATGQNTGSITVEGGSVSVSENYIGGVVGLSDVKNCSQTSTSWAASNTNYADITVRTPLRVVVGGSIGRDKGLSLAAGTAVLTSARNSGNIVVESPGDNSYIGGVVGWHGRGRLGNANAFGKADAKTGIKVVGGSASVYVGAYAGWIQTDNGNNYPSCCSYISGFSCYGEIDAPGTTCGVLVGAVNLTGASTTNGIMLGSAASERPKVSSSFVFNGTTIDDVASPSFNVNTFFGAINPSTSTNRNKTDNTSLKGIWYFCTSGGKVEVPYTDGIVTVN